MPRNTENRRRSYSHEVELDDQERAVSELLYLKDEDLHEQKNKRKERRRLAVGLKEETQRCISGVQLQKTRLSTGFSVCL